MAKSINVRKRSTSILLAVAAFPAAMGAVHYFGIDKFFEDKYWEKQRPPAGFVQSGMNRLGRIPTAETKGDISIDLAATNISTLNPDGSPTTFVVKTEVDGRKVSAIVAMASSAIRSATMDENGANPKVQYTVSADIRRITVTPPDPVLQEKLNKMGIVELFKQVGQAGCRETLSSIKDKLFADDPTTSDPGATRGINLIPIEGIIINNNCDGIGDAPQSADASASSTGGL